MPTKYRRGGRTSARVEFCESGRMRRGIEPRMELADNYRSVQISIIARRERGKRVKVRRWAGHRAWKGTTQLREIELGTSTPAGM